MATPTNLMHKYNEIILSPIDSSACVSGECASMLYNSEWVTILVIRSPKLGEPHSIEVEVSFPICVIDPNSSSSGIQQKEAREFTYSTINYLNYLLKLQDSGFTLGIISAEGIWSAVIEIKEALDESFFEKIIPPTK